MLPGARAAGTYPTETKTAPGSLLVFVGEVLIRDLFRYQDPSIKMNVPGVSLSHVEYGAHRWPYKTRPDR